MLFADIIGIDNIKIINNIADSIFDNIIIAIARL